jgi:Tfp pilus assembly protein PilO
MTNLQKRNATVAAAAAILTIAVYNWFVTPHSQYLMAEQKYRMTIESLETKNKILSSNLKAYSQTLENLRGKYEQHKKLFFDANSAKDFLAGIQTTAENNGCLIQNLRFITPREFPQLGNDIIVCQHQVSLKILGGYGNILKFLNTLQNRTQRVCLDSINVDIDSQTGGLECGLLISIYTLKVKENTENAAK